MSFDPGNILVIDFGQLGDVVMSLPALRAIRQRFADSRITLAVGKPGAEIVDLSGYADATLVVDRVALRDGFKPLSVFRVFTLVKEVRRRRFDFVIDLHSLFETNLLGFFSGASQRLYSRRPGRSLDYLANFRPRPPVDNNNPNRHLIDRYLDVLIPLGITNAPRIPQLKTRLADDLAVEALLKKAKADRGRPLIGLFPGAGHPGRRWPVERFVALADYLARNHDVRNVVFAGPEERELIREMRDRFLSSTVFFDRLTIGQLASAQARLAAFVSNDTGPMHIAAAVGTPVIALLDCPTPHCFIPPGEHHRIVYSHGIQKITIDEVYAATREVLASSRTAQLFTQ